MRQLKISLPLLIFSLTVSRLSAASWGFLPENYHQLYQTYGLFIDSQTTVLNYGRARLWGALGGTLALFGDPEAESHPEIVAQGTANAAMRYDDNFRIYTDTVDARAGFSFDFSLNPRLRLSLGFEHFSGHAADGIVDPDLFTPNLGDDHLLSRVVYDIDRKWRMGLTFNPKIRTFPEMKWIALNEFVEFFPFGSEDSPRKPAPFAAASLEHYGAGRYILTFHAQVGVSFGNHFGKAHRPSFRAVIGYYTGADPRLKYMQYKNLTTEFGYLGVMVDL